MTTDNTEIEVAPETEVAPEASTPSNELIVHCATCDHTHAFLNLSRSDPATWPMNLDKNGKAVTTDVDQALFSYLQRGHGWLGSRCERCAASVAGGTEEFTIEVEPESPPEPPSTPDVAEDAPPRRRRPR